MYPGKYATARADQPASSWPRSGEVVTYGEYEARTNRLAHLLRDQGLQRLDHYSIFMENNARYLEMCGAGERSGLYYTCINSHLTADELAYIVNNSESRVLITSREKLDVVREVVAAVPGRRALAGRRRPARRGAVRGLRDGRVRLPRHARSTTSARARRCSTRRARPVGRRASSASSPTCRRTRRWPLMQFLIDQWRYREGQIYLSPAPLYHSAPQAAVGLTIRIGGTVIIMERFDPEQYLQLVERYRVTHSQLVPTMFSRMLKLPDDVRVALRPVVARDRRPRRRAVPDPGQGGDDRVVGPEDPRVLRAPPRASASRRATPTSGSPTRARSGGASSACCTSSTTSSTRSRRHAGHDLVRGAGRARRTGRTRRRRRRRRRRTGR